VRLRRKPMDSTPPTDNPVLSVYLEKRANLVRFFAARLGSLEASEDLAQDLYLKVAALGPIEDLQSPMALLYRMGANLMLDRLRQERRAAARDDAWLRIARTTVGGEDVVDQPPADEVLASRQRLAKLVAELEGLPPRMRRAFQLHKLEGMSHAETARAMGISVSAVEKHVSGALKALMGRPG
jgi:RNA polymerase sigma factor (sigma-70 family)